MDMDYVFNSASSRLSGVTLMLKEAARQRHTDRHLIIYGRLTVEWLALYDSLQIGGSNYNLSYEEKQAILRAFNEKSAAEYAANDAITVSEYAAADALEATTRDKLVLQHEQAKAAKLAREASLWGASLTVVQNLLSNLAAKVPRPAKTYVPTAYSIRN